MVPVKSLIILLSSVLLVSAQDLPYEPDPSDYENEITLKGPISINIKGKRQSSNEA